MQAFTSSTHRLHDPKFYLADGTVRPCPDSPARVDAILAALQSDPKIQISAPLDLDIAPRLTRIHDADYLDYLRTIHTTFENEFRCDLLPDTFRPPRTPTPLSRPSKPSAQAGYYCFDMAAPITAGTSQAAMDAARCAISAAQSSLQNHASYALCRPPGHHAGANYCGGFCYLNNAALAAQYFRDNGRERVAILDIDYHHGNGTQDIFYHRSDVFYLSIHADPNTQYPYFWGHAHETGVGEGQGFNLNLPLPRGAGNDQWFNAFNSSLARLKTYSPAAVVISLGLDTAEGDTVGDFHLAPGDFHQIGETLAALQLPTAIIQEGGYNLRNLALTLTQFLTPFI